MSDIPIHGVPRTNLYDPFSLDNWDPLKGFQFENPVAAPHHRVPFSNEITIFFRPRIEWKTIPDAYVLTAKLPWLEKEEVNVEFDGELLKISGERRVKKEEKRGRWQYVEEGSGKFLRGFRLPRNVRVDKISTSVENGVLTVIVPIRKI